MNSGPQKQHQWLDRLVGEWTYVSEASMEPGQPPGKFSGTESVRSLGGFWAVCEAQGDMPDGDAMRMIITLGYDAAKERYVGTFVGSMMPHMWIYEGQLDPTGNVLTLDTDGPSFTTEGKMTKYKDVIEFKGDDQRTLTSTVLGDDGEWHQIMTSTYQRKK